MGRYEREIDSQLKISNRKNKSQHNTDDKCPMEIMRYGRRRERQAVPHPPLLFVLKIDLASLLLALLQQHICKSGGNHAIQSASTTNDRHLSWLVVTQNCSNYRAIPQTSIIRCHSSVRGSGRVTCIYCNMCFALCCVALCCHLPSVQS